jgi:type II secretory pathway predicted ATPase ExeA
MWLEDWQLTGNPFADGTDGDYFLGGRCEEALSRLLFVVEQGWSCGSVAGAARSGKSRLLKEVARQSAERCRMIVPVDATGLARREFAAALVQSLGKPAPLQISPWEVLADLLHGLCAANFRSLWLIDQFDDAAEPLDLELLRLIRLVEQSGRRGTVLVAHRAPLPSPNWASFVDLGIVLEPWTAEECRDFIRQRLQTAGASTDLITDAACDILAKASEGRPGSLQRLCTLALQAAWTLGEEQVDADLVKGLCQELFPARTGSPAAFDSRGMSVGAR